MVVDYRTSRPFGDIRLKGKKKRICVERFVTYVQFYSRRFLFDQLPDEIGLPPLVPNLDGYSVLEAFYCVETFGCGPFVPCKKPLILHKSMVGKQQLNWQIKQWAEGYGDWLIFEWELREWYPNFPEWVFEAVLQQGRLRKLANYEKQSSTGLLI